MEKGIKKRTIAIGGRKTSLTLEDAFWRSAREIAAERELTLTELINQIRGVEKPPNLSSAIRLFVLDHYKSIACKYADKKGTPQRREPAAGS